MGMVCGQMAVQVKLPELLADPIVMAVAMMIARVSTQLSMTQLLGTGEGNRIVKGDKGAREGEQCRHDHHRGKSKL